MSKKTFQNKAVKVSVFKKSIEAVITHREKSTTFTSKKSQSGITKGFIIKFFMEVINDLMKKFA